MPELFNRASSRNNGEWGPEDFGLLAWTYDPQYAASSSIIPAVAGTVNFAKLKIQKPISVSNILYSVLANGSGLTSGQCFIALHQNGTLIGVSADQSVAWTTSTLKTTALVGGPFAIAPGDLHVTFFYNGTTAPAIARQISYEPQTNINLGTAAKRYGQTVDTGRTTTMPSPLGAVAAGTAPDFWFGLT
ncbi:MAG TPA: hypothetical protein VNF91_04640 [Candidatus Acidoferrum sp.]|nr:hypothetical protein [Candidatus Acidoferrum sp.]